MHHDIHGEWSIIVSLEIVLGGLKRTPQLSLCLHTKPLTEAQEYRYVGKIILAPLLLLQ